jgi:hypothetical protein
MKRISGAAIAAMMGVVLLGGLLAAQSSAPGANAQTPSSSGDWQFAVSGDSRNCGDVVMPAIAADVLKHHTSFYWHLGDFRATYAFDEDYVHQPEHVGRPLKYAEYLASEWQDFIDNQMRPFGDLPVFLGIGNHETVPPKTRDEYIATFADWLDTPVLREQRLSDDPLEHRLHAYYHWRRGNVDFITLDNATNDQFDPEQTLWIENLLERDAADPGLATIVLGMHEALPDSVSDDHSMTQSPTGQSSGRRLYQDLLRVYLHGHKHIYIIASHSHFYLPHAFDTAYISAHGGSLPGWVVGSAGAVRYSLPKGADPSSRTNVYGYLLATVHPDGMIDFAFQELKESAVPPEVVNRYKQEFVHWCWTDNSQAKYDIIP